ncbi:MAG TPA: hypothetical protein VGU43_03650 [Thermoplasmata archaeon]|nr:hypothetical protein [Thermoplasmata archaeon]
MPPRRLGTGRFRRWLGTHLAGDPDSGDRVLRRLLHLAAALAAVYYLVPPVVTPGVTRAGLLLAVLVVVLALEAARLAGWIELPGLRVHEAHRPASFVYFGIAIVVVLLAVPEPYALVAILGAAWVDPLIGELRSRPSRSRAYPVLPVGAYAAIAFLPLWWLGHFSVWVALLLALGSAGLAVAVESPRHHHVDDDLLMTLVPAAALWIAGSLIGRIT